MEKITFAVLLCFCIGLAGYADSNNGGRTTFSYAINAAEISQKPDVVNPADSKAITAPHPVVAAPVVATPVAQENDEAEDVPVEPVNIQLIPGIGTAGFNHRATNHVLFGILGAAGYNLQGFGLGAIGLSNTGYVSGFQVSGLYNTVSRDMIGFQKAGIFNWVREDMRGVQIAGMFNITGGSDAGLGLAGGFNWAGGDVRGGRIAGVFNITGGSGTGLQLAGIFNWTQGSFRGLQMGLVNHDGGDGSGVRIGLVNVSGSENVIPIGLVNVIKDGLMHPALWYDDLGFVNLSLKSGSRNVYSILGLGVHNDLFFDNDRMFVTRVGIGAELPLNRVFLNFDLTAGQIFFDWPWDKQGGSAFIAQARFSAGYKIFKHLGIFAGVSYDYILSPRGSSPKLGKDFGFSDFAWSDGRNTHKVGFFGGIQF